jgi:acyl-CoA reductase-like NAD-dependent aldehyde dehydrogenase
MTHEITQPFTANPQPLTPNPFLSTPFPLKSPLDGSPLSPVTASSPDEIANLMEKARTAQKAWEEIPVKERCRIIAQAGKHLLAHADALSANLHQELGKPVADTYAVDLGSSPQVFSYFTANAPKMLANKRVKFNPIMFPRKKGLVERVPHGVIALITPWNYPVSIPVHNLVPMLLAGNAVILKPSEYAARTGALLVKILAEKLPLDLLSIVQGDGRQGEQLLRAGVDFVSFIGGRTGGQAVAKTAADLLIPVSLELGGKDAAIVLEDADLDRAVRGITWAGLVNAGQSCAAVERIYVVEAVADQFISKLVDFVQTLRIGDDANEAGSVDIGAITSERQLKIIEQQVNEAVAMGAKVLCGGKRQNQFYLPTVITNVNADMSLMQSETFGPVLPIQIVKDETEALSLANAAKYDLTGSVWTRDLDRGLHLARQLKTGVASVNNHMFSGAEPRAVWGGRNYSGYGVQNSELAIQAFTRPRLLAVDANPVISELWWLPYDQNLVDMTRGMLTFLSSAPLSKRLKAVFTMTKGVLFRSQKFRK